MKTLAFAILLFCCGCASRAASFNYLPNADFADVAESGIPTGWGTMHWGIWYEDFEALRRGWRMAPEASRDGISSFLLDSEAAGKEPLAFASCITGAPRGEKTFSVWLKSDKPGSTVVVVMNIGGEAERTFAPTEEWQRFSFSIDNPATSGRIIFHARGRVFVNSPQLEAGSEPTDFQTRESFPVEGDMDLAASRSFSFQMTAPDGSPMNHPTDATVSVDDEGFHFTFVNAIPESRLEPVKDARRDNDLWGGNDTIQLFFLPQGEDGPLYQFIISNDGTVQDLRSTNSFWDGVWEARTTFEPGKQWTADVSIPFAAFSDGGHNMLACNWKWLVGRENALEGELGVNVPTKSSFFVFGTKDRWASLKNLPVDSANHADVHVGKAFAIEIGRIAFPVVNNAQHERTFTVRRAVCSSNGPWRELDDMDIAIAAGGVATVAMEAPKEFPGCRISLIENGKIVAARSDNCSFANGPKPTTWRPQELMIALFCEPDPTAFTSDVLAQIKALGYNTVIFINPPRWGENGVGDVLDRLHAAGLKGVCNFDYHDAESAHYDYMTSVVSKFKDHPALAGWLVCDEPNDGWGGVDFTQKGYRLLKVIDGVHPIWINYTCNFKLNRPLVQDMLGFDHYPVPDYDIREFLPMVEAATQYGDSAFVYFQQTGHSYFYGREPTVAEFRFMGAAALLKGAVALGTFAQLPLSAELRRRMPEVLGAFQQEFPIWTARRFPLASPLSNIVETEGRIADNGLFAIYVNTLRSPVDFNGPNGQPIHLDGLAYAIVPLE